MIKGRGYFLIAQELSDLSKDKLNKLTVEDLDNLSYEELEQYYKEL